MLSLQNLLSFWVNLMIHLPFIKLTGEVKRKANHRRNLTGLIIGNNASPTINLLFISNVFTKFKINSHTKYLLKHFSLKRLKMLMEKA